VKYHISMSTSSNWIQHHQTSASINVGRVYHNISWSDSYALIAKVLRPINASADHENWSKQYQAIQSLLAVGPLASETSWPPDIRKHLQPFFKLNSACGFWKIFIVIPCSLFSFLSLLGTVSNQQHRKLAPSSDYQRRQSHLRSEYFLFCKM